MGLQLTQWNGQRRFIKLTFLIFKGALENFLAPLFLINKKLNYIAQNT